MHTAQFPNFYDTPPNTTEKEREMWQSMLIAAPSVGSVRTNSIGDFPHVKHSNRKTLASYRLPENFRSIALYPKSRATRLFCSGLTDPVTGNDKGYEFGDENGNNDRFSVGNMSKSREDLCIVLGLLFERVPSIKSKLDDMKLNPDEDLVRSVLGYHCVPGENLFEFFKWAAEHDSRIVKKSFVDRLIRKVSTDADTNTAHRLWGFLQEVVYTCNHSVVMTTEMLNQQISLFSDLGEAMAAYDVFHNFGKLGCARNADTYYLTIEALCEESISDVAGLVCERMISQDMLPDGEKQVGGIIDLFCQGGMVKEALSVYKSAKEKKIQVPRSDLRRLVNFLCTRKNEDDDYRKLAVQMLQEMDDLWVD